MSLQYIVLSIGARFVTAGFAGENAPVVVKRTTRYDLSGIISTTEKINDINDNVLWSYSAKDNDLKSLEFTLEKIVYDLLTQELLIDPKRSKIVFIESLYLPIPYKEIITRTCLFNLHCISLTFVPEAVMSCVGSGSSCALVVDLGWIQSVVSPVFDLRLMYKESKSTIRAGGLIHQYVYESFKEHGDISLDFEFIERFIIETGYCRTGRTSAQDDKEFTFEGVKIPNRFRYEAIERCIFEDLPFTKPDDENYKVIDLITDMINKFPIDLKGTIPSKIIFTGGVSEIKGVKAAILHELSKAKQDVQSIITLGPWKGTSLYLSVASLSSQSKNKPIEIYRDKYIAEEQHMIDWIDSLYQ